MQFSGKGKPDHIMIPGKFDMAMLKDDYVRRSFYVISLLYLFLLCFETLNENKEVTLSFKSKYSIALEKVAVLVILNFDINQMIINSLY